MNSKKTLVVSIKILVVAAVVLLAPKARAVTLIPPSMEFSVNPGEVIETNVKLFNETAETVTQYPSTANFTAKDETGVPDFDLESAPADLASWVTIGAGPYVLEPGSRQTIPVTITVPAAAEPGGHYAGIFFSGTPPEGASDQPQIAIASKIGSLVLIRVAGQIQEAGSITSFGTALGRTSFSRLPIDFVLRMQNDGNVHFRPTGNVTVRNVLGGTSTVLAMNQTLGAVLPASTRRFDVSWEKMPNAAERGGFFSEIAAEWDNFAFGPYTASVDLMYGQANDKSATATFQFWVFPWRVMLISLLVLAAVVFLIILLIRRYNRWLISRIQGTKNE
ncbi:MAG: hypothetical protein HY340_01310 [Candidatus Kerfeldbacteria bacterium]|nr:hypothetical protein [Candidatus Kerfeldbacteria bacterium]